MNYLQGLFKPMLSMKLELPKLFKVNFKVDLINDEMHLDGTGIKKNSISISESICKPMTVTENQQYKSILDKNIRKNIPKGAKWYFSYITIDFVDMYVKTEVFYVHENGNKKTMIFKSNF